MSQLHVNFKNGSVAIIDVNDSSSVHFHWNTPASDPGFAPVANEQAFALSEIESIELIEADAPAPPVQTASPVPPVEAPVEQTPAPGETVELPAVPEPQAETPAEPVVEDGAPVDPTTAASSDATGTGEAAADESAPAVAPEQPAA